MDGIKVIESGNSITIEWDKNKYPNLLESVKVYLEDLADIDLAEDFEKKRGGTKYLSRDEFFEAIEVNKK